MLLENIGRANFSKYGTFNKYTLIRTKMEGRRRERRREKPTALSETSLAQIQSSHHDRQTRACSSEHARTHTQTQAWNSAQISKHAWPYVLRYVSMQRGWLICILSIHTKTCSHCLQKDSIGCSCMFKRVHAMLCHVNWRALHNTLTQQCCDPLLCL